MSASEVVDTLNKNSTELINGRSARAEVNAQVDTLLKSPTLGEGDLSLISSKPHRIKPLNSNCMIVAP